MVANAYTGTRRQFLISGMLAGASMINRNPLYAAATRKPNSKIGNVQVGAITYSYWSYPDRSAEATLQYCLDSGISAIELMGVTGESYAGLAPDATSARIFAIVFRGGPPGSPAAASAPPLSAAQEQELASLRATQAEYQKQASAWRERATMEKYEQLRKLYNRAGVNIYAYKPDAFADHSSDAEIDYGMRAAKVLGASHVTVELPEDAAHIGKLGRAAAKYDLRVGYHNHEQATPTKWDAAFAASKASGANLDIGHYTATSYDGLAFMRANHQRITSMHMKDRKTKANGGANLPWGQGDTPLAAALRLMRDQRYHFPATIELEYPIPSASDAVKEVRKCLDYCRDALSRDA